MIHHMNRDPEGHLFAPEQIPSQLSPMEAWLKQHEIRVNLVIGPEGTTWRAARRGLEVCDKERQLAINGLASKLYRLEGLKPWNASA